MKLKTIIISILLACFVPFASVHAADPIIPITSLDQLTTFAQAVGNFRLDADLTMSANITFKEGFTLDLNGHTLNTNAFVMIISGTVTVKDTSADHAGKIIGKTKQMIQVGANRTFTLESGTLSSTAYPIYVVANGNAIINGGLVEASGAGVPIINKGNITINDGVVKTTASDKAIQTDAGSTLTINGGSVEATTSVAVLNSGTTTVNGGTLYSRGSSAIYGNSNSITIINDGTVKTDSASTTAAAVMLSKPGAKLTMNGGQLIATASDPQDSGKGGTGIMAFKETEVTITGGRIESNSFALAGNGSISGDNEGTNAIFTITGGTLISEKTAIYAPQPNGVTTISGGTITGADVALELRAGTLEISGGTFNGGAGNPYESTPNYSGTTAKNAAIVVAQHSTKLPIDVKITGGTFNAEVPFVENNPQSNSAEDVAKISLEITTDDYDNSPVFNADGDYTIFSEDVTAFVKAGRYTHDVPDDYIAPDHGEIIEDDNMNAVYPYHQATVEETPNGTVDVSVEQTVRGIEVTINPQPAPGYAVTSIEVVDAAGNNIPVVNNKYIAPNYNTTVTVEFGIPNPATADEGIADYGIFCIICAAGLVTAISGARLAYVRRRVL